MASGHPKSKSISIKSTYTEGVFKKCGKQENMSKKNLS
jgi:hypothetical protein